METKQPNVKLTNILRGKVKTINKIIKWFIYGSEVKVYPLPKVNEMNKKQAKDAASQRSRSK